MYSDLSPTPHHSKQSIGIGLCTWPVAVDRYWPGHERRNYQQHYRPYAGFFLSRPTPRQFLSNPARTSTGTAPPHQVRWSHIEHLNECVTATSCTSGESGDKLTPWCDALAAAIVEPRSNAENVYLARLRASIAARAGQDQFSCATYDQVGYRRFGRNSSGPNGQSRRELDWGSPNKLMPDESWTYQDFVDCIVSYGEKIASGEEKVDCECDGTVGWRRELTEFNKNLRRFHLPHHNTCAGCFLGNGALEDGLHILLFMTPKQQHRLITQQYNLISQRWPNLCTCQIKKILKKQTASAKLGGKYIDVGWRNLCYWETFYGYLPYKGVEAMKKDVETWLVNPIKLGGPLTEQEYLSMLAEEMVRLMDEEWSMPPRTLEPEDWVATGRWMRGRSGTGPATTVEINQKITRTRRMKGVDASLLSDKDMTEQLSHIVQETFHIMEKSEGGKIRPIVKTGSAMFRKMDYLSQWCEEGFKNSKISTLFGSAGNQEWIDRDILASTRNPNLWKVPMDQSNFDWHQSKASIMTIIATMGMYIAERTKAKGFSKVWQAMWDSIFAQQVVVHCGKYKYTWENGMPSGFRWTALIDTLLNITSFRVALRIASEIKGRYIHIAYHRSQGDDVAFATADLKDVALIMHIYNRIGYEAHPSKTFFSRYRTEFLRKSYEADLGITGYLARSLLSIRFRSPILEMPIVRATRLYSRLTAWHLMTLRGATPKSAVMCYLWDAEQIGVDKTTAANFALTPSSFGGAGLWPDGLMSTYLKPYFRHYTTYEVKTEYHRIEPRLGHWDTRLKNYGSYLRPREIEAFKVILAKSWGIRDVDAVKEARIEWKDCNMTIKRPTQWPAPLPHYSEFWDLEGIPVLIRPHVITGALDSGTWQKLAKPEMVPQIAGYIRRVSKNVARAYLSGQVGLPWPMLDGIAMKYGSVVRKMLDVKLRQICNIKDLGMRDLSQYAGWLERGAGLLLQQEYYDGIYAT
nr:hypothetical protein 2 [Totiviridae sp.]